MPNSPSNTYNSKKKTAPNPLLGKIQPQAIDFEKAVLAALMIEKDAFSSVSEIIDTESFYVPAHQQIFSAIVSLYSAQKPVDILTVSEELKRLGKLEEIGGIGYLNLLTDEIASAAHIEYHARIIAQKYFARELISFSSNVSAKAYDETNDIDDVMQETEGRLFEISQRNVKKDFTQINPVIKEALKNIEEAAKRKDGLSGISSGYDDLDKLTAGWQRSDLIIIAARPAMGKTAFVLSMAKNIAIDHKKPLAFFSLEMSNIQLLTRMISNVAEISGDKLRSGRLEEEEWVQLDAKTKELFDAPIFIDDTPSLSVFELRTKARRLVREYNVEMLIIDYLQLMNASGMSYGNREQEVSMISRSLKGLAKELNIPVIALSQLNRSVESRNTTGKGPDNKRPQLSDLRESGAIEQDADLVCFIHRPEYYKIEEDENGNSLKNVAEIIISKHRNGPIGIANLIFESEYARFKNPTEYKKHGRQANNHVYESKINQQPENDGTRKVQDNGASLEEESGFN